MRTSLSLLLVLCASLVGACSKGAGPRPAAGGAAGLPGAGAADPSTPVARINGQAVTEAELATAARGQMATLEGEYVQKVYDTRSQALNTLIDDRLVAAKAKTAGLPVDKLIEREVNAKVAQPTDAEIQSVYDRTKAGGRPLPPFEQVKADIIRFMTKQKTEQAHKEFADKLRTEAKVELLLPPVLMPKVEVAAVGPTKGNPNAPITIIEFSDFECPYCSRAEESVKRVLDEYKDKVRLVYREYPLPFHASAQKASEAALCAGDQGKYWEMHEKLFASQQALAVPQLKEYAHALGVTAAKFDSCLDSGEKAKIIDESKKAAEAVGVNGTPAFFINGRPMAGARPFEDFKKLIDSELLAAK